MTLNKKRTTINCHPFFILMIIRGLGINFKKFNFDSDISKFEISESDKEEFELNINFDVDTARRERKRKLRYFKYLYKENKMVFYIGLSLLILISGFVFFSVVLKKDNSLKEGFIYSMNNFC